MKNVKTVKNQQNTNIVQSTEISVLNPPSMPKRAPKFLVQGDSNRLRY